MCQLLETIKCIDGKLINLRYHQSRFDLTRPDGCLFVAPVTGHLRSSSISVLLVDETWDYEPLADRW